MAYLFSNKENKHFLFIHPPKSAGTGIMNQIKKHTSGGKFEGAHRTVSELETMVEQQTALKFDNIYKFSVVRNPWSRLLSSYFYGLQMKGIWPEYISGDKDIDDDFNNWVKWLYSDKFDRNTQLGVPGRKLHIWNKQFTNQTNFFKSADFKTQYNIDKIIRVEDFEEELAPFFENVLKIPPPDPKTKVNATKRRDHYSTFYNDESKALVEKWFADDIERFNYSFKE